METQGKKGELTMSKMIIITEKPSVAQDYRKYLQVNSTEKNDGYIEGYSTVFNKEVIITWARGHLVTMSYPQAYDESLKQWSLDSLPFLPAEYKYEVIADVKKQFYTIKKLYHRDDIDAIYYAGDSAREGLYIQMLIRQIAGVKRGITEKVVWIDSTTEKEILRGIREAKDISAYQLKKESAYMRAIEDYAVGINFSRALTCKFGADFNKTLGTSSWTSISAGRVMSCVLGMIVSREREIKNFVVTPFYRVVADVAGVTANWKAVSTSAWFESPLLYNETGFIKESDASLLVNTMQKTPTLTVDKVKTTEEKKGASLLFNLAELQYFCSKKYKISPDDTLAVAQKLYEAKMITYPRTDARVLSTAIASDLRDNLNGLAKFGYKSHFIKIIAQNGWHHNIVKSPYVDDAKISDHYAIIPTGNTASVNELSDLELNIFYDIIERFLCIFFPPCVYEKTEVVFAHVLGERFFASAKTIKSVGFMAILDETTETEENPLSLLKEGDEFNDIPFSIKEGTTTPPKRYTSGSMVIAMENAGKMIEDEELRANIIGSGIGTSATRASIIKKLVDISYIQLNKKTQILTPTVIGESVYDILLANMPALLSPEMTASWEKGLTEIEDGKVTAEEYRRKLEKYVTDEVNKIKQSQSSFELPEGVEIQKLMCPVCGKGEVRENSKGFGCSDYRNGCKFFIQKEIAGKKITVNQVAKLVAGERTGVLKGFKNKEGKEFSASLELQNGKVAFVFPRKKS